MNCFDLASQAAKKVDARKCPLCFMKLVNKEQGFFFLFQGGQERTLHPAIPPAPAYHADVRLRRYTDFSTNAQKKKPTYWREYPARTHTSYLSYVLLQPRL